MGHSRQKGFISPFSLDPGGNLTVQTADGIAAAIERGRWKAGDVLPTAREWQSALGVGAYVPRAAMKLLAERGVLTVKKHVGGIVTGRGIHKWEGRIAFVTTTTRVSFYENAHAFALQELFENAGWQFVHISVKERHEDDKEPDLSSLKRHITHGIDFAICFTGSRQIATALDEARVRYVFEGGTGRDFPNAEAVINLEMNSQNAAERLAKHWSSAKISDALIVDFEHVMPRTITSTIFSSGIKFRQIVVKCPNSRNYLQDIQQAGLDAVAKFFAAERNRTDPPDAIFFYDDYLAAGGLIALAATGLRVPEDIRVATLANKGFGPVWFKPADCDGLLRDAERQDSSGRHMDDRLDGFGMLDRQVDLPDAELSVIPQSDRVCRAVLAGERRRAAETGDAVWRHGTRPVNRRAILPEPRPHLVHPVDCRLR